MTDSPDYATLSETTATVKVYPDNETAKEWREEAEDHGRSLSKHLQVLIHEARSYREHGLLRAEGDQRRLQELQEEKEQLEARVEEKRAESSEAVSFEPSTLKNEVLTENYQSLEDILRNIVESQILDEALRQPVENQLYFLAARDEVEYERGWGWKLSEGNGGEE